MKKIDKRFDFVVQTKGLYEKRLSYKITNRRNRENVEHRAALSNGVKPFASVIIIGKALGMDHSTIVHYTKQHESYFRWSPEYRMYFSTALQCAVEVAELLQHEPMTQTYMTAKTQLKNLDEIIRWAEEIKEKLINDLDSREQKLYLCHARSKNIEQPN